MADAVWKLSRITEIIRIINSESRSIKQSFLERLLPNGIS